MSRLPRLLRALHTSAVRLDSAAAAPAVAAAASSSAPAPAPAPPVKFTPKGRPIVGRPPRTTPVTLPSGYPEPPSYPPPAEYFAQIDAIKTPPKPHPLWAFFHVPTEASLKLKPGAEMPDMGSLERLDDEVVDLVSGRSWTAAELRHKSFEDLHTLWYILLRERNVLATQREERRRLGIASSYGGELLTKRAFRCRKSMARIKYVLNERRLGMIAAAAAQNPHKVKGVVVPTTLPGRNDPIAAVEALAGAPPPNMRKLIPKRKKRTKAAQQGAENGQLELYEETNEVAEAQAAAPAEPEAKEAKAEETKTEAKAEAQVKKE